ncbi:MAG: hypothetical protein COV67_07185 [Nitrospinae bacterium CG11_big_fil_rev_8_21_14_0_20_56_8]|nr:MAG: hypothetical protein COV67_07185 [Nitrospinae bacterium CG11_big_fil_rev_8_21_14_0_20_56_8]
MSEYHPNTKQAVKRRSQAGFTLVEIMVALAVSLLVLALAAGIFQSQREAFTRTSDLGKMQANGRSATDFMARAVQNAGYNVFRGTRFLAASDHYLSTVFDEDNDGVIQADEVVTFAVSKDSGSPTESFSFTAYYDGNDNGTIASDESQSHTISLVLDGPTYNLYKIVPEAGGSTVNKHKVAQYVDNLIIRYYDKNGNALPSGVTTASGKAVPPYTVPASELNDIRRVEFDLLVRSKDEDPREGFTQSGSYEAGSVATLAGASGYNDSYHRLNFESNTSPRNLVMAPWGKMEISALPNPVSCPDTSTVVTASLVDSQGDAVEAGIDINFNATAGTVSPSSNSTNYAGESTTTLTYDWSSPSTTVTLSANALMTISGKEYPVFSAIPIAFQSGTGVFTDNFDDGDSTGWDEGGVVNWNVAAGEYKSASNGFGYSINGCAAWQDYEMQMETGRNGSFGATSEYAGMILRYQDTDHYYMVRVYCSSCTANPNDDIYNLQIVSLSNGTETIIADTVSTTGSITFANNTDYTIKGYAVGTALKAKIWATADAEPADWALEETDASYSSGKVGLVLTKSVLRFDDITVTPVTVE